MVSQGDIQYFIYLRGEKWYEMQQKFQKHGGVINHLLNGMILQVLPGDYPSPPQKNRRFLIGNYCWSMLGRHSFSLKHDYGRKGKQNKRTVGNEQTNVTKETLNFNSKKLFVLLPSLKLIAKARKSP